MAISKKTKKKTNQILRADITFSTSSLSIQQQQMNSGIDIRSRTKAAETVKYGLLLTEELKIITPIKSQPVLLQYYKGILQTYY